MQRLHFLSAIALFALSSFSAQAEPTQRILTHSYGSGSQAVVITLIDILPDGPVRILSSLPSGHPRHSVSHAEFEQMWKTLLANGAKKLQPAIPAETVDGADNYYFSLAAIPGGTGCRFVVPKELLVPNRDAAPAVVAVARHIRGLVSTR